MNLLRFILVVATLFVFGGTPPAQEIASTKSLAAISAPAITREIAQASQEVPKPAIGVATSTSAPALHLGLLEAVEADFTKPAWDNRTVSPSAPLQTEAQIAIVVPGADDYNDLGDVERTYYAVAGLLGREPTMEELMYMTISSEYWLLLKKHGQTLVGQEAVARSYYQFCGMNECTKEELFKFLSGYQVWFGRSGKTDENVFRLAENMYNMLVNRYNYINGNGPKLRSQIAEILDVEFAQTKGWHVGVRNDRPRQWFGPRYATEGNGVSLGYGANDYAIEKIPLGNGQFFYFFTYAQELQFNP